jgi:hypothetical protein
MKARARRDTSGAERYLELIKNYPGKVTTPLFVLDMHII